MFRLTIAYSNGAISRTSHETKDAALWFLHNEGDHVVAHKLEYHFGWDDPRKWTHEELISDWIIHGGKL